MSSLRELEDKKKALADYLKVSPDRITESKGTLYSFKALYHGPNHAYLVLTDIEANVAARRAIKSRMWLISLESVFPILISAHTRQMLLINFHTMKLKK